MRKIEEIATTVVDTAFHLHRDLGPGLLETVYEAVLEKMLSDRGLVIERQKPVPIEFAGLIIDEGAKETKKDLNYFLAV